MEARVCSRGILVELGGVNADSEMGEWRVSGELGYVLFGHPVDARIGFFLPASSHEQTMAFDVVFPHFRGLQNTNEQRHALTCLLKSTRAF